MEELHKRLQDYFDPWDLVDLLGVTTEEIVEAFQEKIEENADLLEDYMCNGR